MTFSQRTAWDLAEHDFAAAVRSRRAAGEDLIDLSCANPTLCGFSYNLALLDALSDAASMRYVAQPLGSPWARAAVSAYYADSGAAVSIEHVCLTTSTSEAYSYLFRLLCDPGDEVLVARPSYPLFDFIAQLDGVVLREYPLVYDPHTADDAGWGIDLHALEKSITPRTRALIVVHPNNPTGNFVPDAEKTALQKLCCTKGIALIVDEVFLDYALGPAPPSFAVAPAGCLTFVLSGLSKVCALPQMKASWIAATGPTALVAAAMQRLEVVADTFLSMNAPVQQALPAWLKDRGHIQRQIRSRMQENLRYLDAHLQGSDANRLMMQGGWTTVIRVPRTVEHVPFVYAALDRGVIVQAGDLYGLPDGRIVLSLLTPPGEWQRGLARLPLYAL